VWPGVSRAMERVVGVLVRRSGGGERRLFGHSAIGVVGGVRGYVSRGIWGW
jgi:predicted NUDIX family phosphoesterase